jgi:uracil-DNA glycosylase family 4
LTRRSDPARRARLVERLKFLDEIGAGFVTRDELGRASAGRTAAPSSPPPAAGPGAAPAGPRLDELHEKIRACRKCGLAEGRTHAVPGEGDPRAALIFVGEGPGHDEDVQGRPFVGRAGQLLTRIIAAMGLERSQVFITNIVKCRPPGNRVPRREEVEACSPYLEAQVRALRPRVIVTLGKSAADFFFPDAALAMTALRGTFREWNGIPVMPTFHPSYLVRNEGNVGLKRMVWNDMKKVMALLAGK